MSIEIRVLQVADRAAWDPLARGYKLFYETDTSDADYVETMLGAIVMIEVPIVELVGKFKLGQNRGMDDRLGTEDGLVDRGNTALAADMLALRKTP